MSWLGKIAAAMAGLPRIGAVSGGIEAGALGRRLASFAPATYHVNTLITAYYF